MCSPAARSWRPWRSWRKRPSRGLVRGRGPVSLRAPPPAPLARPSASGAALLHALTWAIFDRPFCLRSEGDLRDTGAENYRAAEQGVPYGIPAPTRCVAKVGAEVLAARWLARWLRSAMLQLSSKNGRFGIPWPARIRRFGSSTPQNPRSENLYQSRRGTKPPLFGTFPELDAQGASPRLTKS